jgi:hypothetical protein
MNVIVFASRKGGTGKSTLAAHLAAHVHKSTKPCLLIDADPQYAGKTADRTRAEHIQKNYQRAAAQPAWFYLKESGPPEFPKSVVSFLELHSIKMTDNNRDYLKQNRILRLTQEAVLDLQFRFSFYFGRFATTDNYMLTDQEIALIRRHAETMACIVVQRLSFGSDPRWHEGRAGARALGVSGTARPSECATGVGQEPDARS